jgi:SOS response regulatory protein OraA/RecX
MDPQQLMQMLLQMGVTPDKIKAILEIIMGGQGPAVQ